MKKIELEKKVEDLNGLNNDKFYEIQRYKEENEKLQKEIEDLNNKIKRIIEVGNSKAEFILNILKIVSGEAKPISKYEVIRDLFSEQLKSIKEEPVSNRVYHNKVYASDQINDWDYSI